MGASIWHWHGDRLWRVQCKWGQLSPDKGDVVVRVGGCLAPNGYVRTTYSEAEVHLFGIYVGELDRCFLCPVALGRRRRPSVISPTRNGQGSCINLADDFDFDGAIAQLGER